MIEKVNKALEQWHMLDGCAGVAVGLSGGADSVSLLHIMCDICAQQGKTLRAVHINHGIRGSEADSDEQFCVSLCEKLSIPIDVFRFDIPSLAGAEGLGLEECGRKYRYECFEKVSSIHDLRIATAHTLSDSAETLLLNLARGCGIAGLRGIPPVRGKIIRPLILASRDDIERYCADNNLEYVTDQTNFDDSYSRNRVRLNIIPELRQLNPDILSAAARLMENASYDEEYLSKLAEQAMNESSVGEGRWQAEKIYTLPRPIRSRVLMRIIEQISGKAPDFTHIELVDNMLDSGTGAVSLPCGHVLCIRNGHICEQQHHYAGAEWCLALDREVRLPDGRLMTVETVDCAEFVRRSENDKSLFKSALNYDIMEKSDTVVRSRRAGDRFSPSGRGVTKTLKKLFNEAHIDIPLRDKLAVIESCGEIIWIEGFGTAGGFMPSESCGVVSIITIK